MKVVLRWDEAGNLFIWVGDSAFFDAAVKAIKRRPGRRRRWLGEWRCWEVDAQVAPGLATTLRRLLGDLVVDDGRHADLFERLRAAWFARLTETETRVVAEFLRTPRPWRAIGMKLDLPASVVGESIEAAWRELSKIRLVEKNRSDENRYKQDSLKKRKEEECDGRSPR